MNINLEVDITSSASGNFKTCRSLRVLNMITIGNRWTPIFYYLHNSIHPDFPLTKIEPLIEKSSQPAVQ